MSMEKLFKKYPVRQIAYYVPDAKKAALRHSQLFGSGPFLVMDNISAAKTYYRGKPAILEQAVTMGQWGDMQVEFCQQKSQEASYYTDLGHYGIHHVCIWVDDVREAIKEFEAEGFELAELMEMEDGSLYAIIDCVKELGHFIEIHLPANEIYGMVKKMAEGFDGKDIFRTFG